MEPVEDTLSTLRKTHLGLFVASVAVLVAAIPGHDYGAAIEEMRLLREFMAETSRARPQSGVMAMCISTSRTNYNSIVEGAVKVALAEREAPFSRFFWSQSWPSVICPYPDEGATLEELAAFISNGVRIDVARPAQDALVEFFQRAGDQLPDSAFRYFRVAWLGREGPEVSRQLPEGARQDSVLVYLGTRDLVADDDLREWTAVLPVRATRGWFTPGAVFRAQEKFTALLGPTEFEVRYPALPTLQAAPFWEEIRTLPPAEAVRYVQSLSRDNDGTVEVLGFRIGAEVLGWAGPPLLVVLLVHLLLHMRHLQRIGPEQPELISRYPWLPLFPDRSAQVSAVLTLGVLPPVAAGLVAWRLLELSEVTAAWAGLMALLTVSLSVRVLMTLQTVRRGAS